MIFVHVKHFDLRELSTSFLYCVVVVAHILYLWSLELWIVLNINDITRLKQWTNIKDWAYATLDIAVKLGGVKYAMRQSVFLLLLLFDLYDWMIDVKVMKQTPTKLCSWLVNDGWYNIHNSRRQWEKWLDVLKTLSSSTGLGHKPNKERSSVAQCILCCE